MKNLFLTVIALCFVSISANAQKYSDNIYLKNGSVINGLIINQVPNESLSLQTKDGNLFVYSVDEIQKITKKITPTYELSTGYKGFVEAGYTIGVGNEDNNDIKINRIEMATIHGYQISPYLFLGLGFGINVYQADKATQIFIPMFLDARANIPSTTNISPFIDLKIGYTGGNSSILKFSDGLRKSQTLKNSGFYLAPSVGVRFALDNKRNALNLSAGYTVQKNPTSYVEDYDYFDYDIKMNGVTFKLGFEF